MNEQWRPVPGYEGWYSVSDRGRVRRELSVTSGKAGHILQPGNVGGYLQLSLCKEGTRQQYKVHRLVAAAFLGPCPAECQVNHLDGVKAHNELENLEYVSQSANIRHALANGLIVNFRKPDGRRTRGFTGMHHSKDARARISAALKGKKKTGIRPPLSPEHKANLRAGYEAWRRSQRQG